VPITVKDIGQVTLGPDIRRGIADLDGKGDAVGGVVIMRSGENALQVIARVKAKMDQDPTFAASRCEDCHHLRPVRTHPGFDPHPEAHALRGIGIVSLVILIFLWHIPSALIPILTIPITVLIAFIPMKA
jgi:copper/silver efflux system protein